MMKKSVDVITVEKWSAGYHQASDHAVLSFEFEDTDDEIAFSMSRETADGIAKALKQISEIQPKPDS